MFLFKASGATYRRVLKQSLHAFPFGPKEAAPGQFVLLSKNREDCALLEKQIQNVAKLELVRPATSEELEERFPGVAAGLRWQFIAQLYWLSPLEQPFNLAEVPGVNYKRYEQVQEFAKIDESDEWPILQHLGRTNERVLLTYLNRSDLPESLRDA